MQVDIKKNGKEMNNFNKKLYLFLSVNMQYNLRRIIITNKRHTRTIVSNNYGYLLLNVVKSSSFATLL